jgi:hypothetical protein
MSPQIAKDLGIAKFDNGRDLLREGAKRSWWHHAAQNERSAIPRHNENDGNLTRRSCRDLGVPKIY